MTVRERNLRLSELLIGGIKMLIMFIHKRMKECCPVQKNVLADILKLDVLWDVSLQESSLGAYSLTAIGEVHCFNSQQSFQQY
jgi:hypothetical protein